MDRYSLDDLIAARRTAADDTDTPEQAAEQAGPAPGGDAWKQALGRFASGLKCANLSMQIEAGSLKKLRGYVSREEDLVALTDVLSAYAETSGTDLKVSVRPWPQCEALSTFSRTLARPQGLDVSIVDESGAPVPKLAGGALLGVAVRGPDFPAYLYVTYLQSAGGAVHLVGWQGGETRHPPGASVSFGLDPKKPRFRVGPPFGREMILAIASTEPLFSSGYDILEEERAYLTRFRQRLLEIGNGRITGQFAAKAVMLETVPGE